MLEDLGFRFQTTRVIFHLNNCPKKSQPESFANPMKNVNPKQSRAEVQQITSMLSTRRINTLTELCRIERIVISCGSDADGRALHQLMGSAWTHYVCSNQFLIELRGLSRNYSLTRDIISEAQRFVQYDPESKRSWNLAWLCLMRMRDGGLVKMYAAREAAKGEMWGEKTPSEAEIKMLAGCFETEWIAAIETMLRHWITPPIWQ